ncbi:hypothetical protein ACFO6R_10905 [Eubacterium multiforme]|uniref:Glucan phosphoethanolaminetransferase (Alkaline phosphatase superfamily) n=1 Tax=Eubacterium multiforme TaxID=83339 RepID=A0ABT9UVF5_9FIRM|nr:hypothetical protein [Eubacterium multiforme]MDQ0150304.1 glucan phosphoethanolaminetransferase (alkaline phosphatase superfamily) [Eubacterium multiforme]
MKKKIFIINIFLLVVWLICLKFIDYEIRLNNLMFTNISINLIASIFTVLLFSLLVQIIMYLYKFVHKRNKKLYLEIIAGLGIFLVVASMVMYLMIGFIFFAFEGPEYTVEKDGKKMVAYVNSFTHVYVEYYDYINPFVHGNKIKIGEDYGAGGYDPFKSKEKVMSKRITYYNDNEEIIKEASIEK